MQSAELATSKTVLSDPNVWVPKSVRVPDSYLLDHAVA